MRLAGDGPYRAQTFDRTGVAEIDSELSLVHRSRGPVVSLAQLNLGRVRLRSFRLGCFELGSLRLNRLRLGRFWLRNIQLRGIEFGDVSRGRLTLAASAFAARLKRFAVSVLIGSPFAGSTRMTSIFGMSAVAEATAF